MAALAATPAAVSEKPSRNARRKAVKRRLRRKGVLPCGSRPAANGAAAPPAAAQPPAAKATSVR